MSRTICAPAAHAAALPRLTTTVPREFVHRAAVAEVLLTGWRREGEDRFLVTAQWPRGHSFFTPVAGAGGRRHDPMLVTETIRQVGSLIAHAEFDVPLGYQFLMWDLSVTTHPERLAVGPVPAELVLEVRCSDVRRRAGTLAGLRYDVVLRRDGAIAATGNASYTCASPEVYRRLRGNREPGLPTRTAPAVPPELVGRHSSFDVVLAPAASPAGGPADASAAGRAGRWLLRAEGDHPVLFDHPVDHIPGMVLLEAARQASAALAPAASAVTPASFTSSFHRYAELDLPCWIEAERDEPDAAGAFVSRVSGHQDGEPVFSCTITTTPPADPSVCQ
ncbi:hypothetical protein BLA24_18495 [Streptomyces cinnamoneus]|uniref:A-factor biosynthesis hotdog domain-containing protein n=1 Tax=Streptomyces cinnamoneus TaxID=53446 RepID=A0A2G1XHQ9_STRCJ|nr:ScbA/BarX family gamma-butyrolactone biosynthesis protein [Streptomyces cinnamoneus]PHQ50765.1 hypothetical protein BLA24_18495 [Streptomyces cinnamoneus]PPT13977.1 hypothetical protein CYQ11_14785 [Streptomyces cinnamoneus]